MPKCLLVLACTFIGATAASPQTSAPPLTQLLPVDSAVKIGTLPNGLRYYIRKNSKPEKRAELRLVVNAGSILENDAQLGVAHIIEHMAFEGTTHFGHTQLLSYLQSIGVRFGADLNAETGFDETVYILPIPTDTARIMDQAFTILEDWAHGQLFDSAALNVERDVVLEEWRGHKGADDRMLQKWLPIAFQGSLYAQRLPIGTEQSIETATPSRLRPFYAEWYRPDLMAVIAVGDFDPAQIQAEITAHFSGLRNPANEQPRPVAPVPDNTAPLIAIATDKEATGSSVELSFKLPKQKTRTVGDYRRNLVEQLYFMMLNARFQEIAQRPDAPFLDAGASLGSYGARTTDAFTLGADVKDGAVDQGLDALLVEARRANLGFLDSELARAKSDMLRGLEQSYAERAKTVSAAYVSQYLTNFLTGAAIPGIETRYRLAQELVPSITIADVNTLAKQWITPNNRVIVVEAPDKPGAQAPTQSGILAVLDKATHDSVAAYTENVSSAPLVSGLPPTGHVVSERAIPGAGVTEWTLSNGARVLVKPTDFKNDEVLVTSYALGGISLAPDADIVSAQLASDIMAQSGVGTFSATDLAKKLSGKVASVSPTIGETEEGLSGSASPRDLETLFQLMYLEMANPRLDSAAFGAFKNQLVPYLTNRGSDPSSVFQDTIDVTMDEHNPRDEPPTLATLAKIDPAKALAFYAARFANPGAFTYVFVGNVTLEALKPLVERYLASLPSTGRKETWKDVETGPPKGVVQRVVKKGVEPKADTHIVFSGPFVYTPENRLTMRALEELVQIRLDDVLREQLGGTYSPGVESAMSRIPREEYQIIVDYGSSPQNVDKLSTSFFSVIEALKQSGPTQADVDKVKEELIRRHEVEVKTNEYWAGNMAARDEAGEDIAGLADAYTEMVKRLTSATLQAAAKQYFDTANYAKFILLPEGTPGSTPAGARP